MKRSRVGTRIERAAVRCVLLCSVALVLGGQSTVRASASAKLHDPKSKTVSAGNSQSFLDQGLCVIEGIRKKMKDAWDAGCSLNDAVKRFWRFSSTRTVAELESLTVEQRNDFDRERRQDLKILALISSCSGGVCWSFVSPAFSAATKGVFGKGVRLAGRIDARNVGIWGARVAVLAFICYESGCRAIEKLENRADFLDIEHRKHNDEKIRQSAEDVMQHSKGQHDQTRAQLAEFRHDNMHAHAATHTALQAVDIRLSQGFSELSDSSKQLQTTLEQSRDTTNTALAGLDGKVGTLITETGTLGTSIGQLSAQITTQGQASSARFDRLDSALEAIAVQVRRSDGDIEKLGGLSEQIKTLGEQLHGLKLQADAQTAQGDSLLTQADEHATMLGSKIDSVQEKVDDNGDELKRLFGKYDELHETLKKLIALENREAAEAPASR